MLYNFDHPELDLIFPPRVTLHWKALYESLQEEIQKHTVVVIIVANVDMRGEYDLACRQNRLAFFHNFDFRSIQAIKSVFFFIVSTWNKQEKGRSFHFFFVKRTTEITQLKRNRMNSKK